MRKEDGKLGKVHDIFVSTKTAWIDFDDGTYVSNIQLAELALAIDKGRESSSDSEEKDHPQPMSQENLEFISSAFSIRSVEESGGHGDIDDAATVDSLAMNIKAGALQLMKSAMDGHAHKWKCLRDTAFRKSASLNDKAVPVRGIRKGKSLWAVMVDPKWLRVPDTGQGHFWVPTMDMTGEPLFVYLADKSAKVTPGYHQGT